MLSFFPRGVLDEILNLIESVSGEFPSYSYYSWLDASPHDQMYSIAALHVTLMASITSFWHHLRTGQEVTRIFYALVVDGRKTLL